MTATYTFDVFSSLDGRGAASRPSRRCMPLQVVPVAMKQNMR
jgi:hypothetical protein